MIASLTGQLSRVLDDRAFLRAGPVEYELLIPAVDVQPLRELGLVEIIFHTLFFLQGDGNFFQPTLIGFRETSDKLFFEKFTTVKGIGPRKALRAMTEAMSDIAAAIENKDAKFLSGLSGIGQRTAETIIAELAGKVGSFVHVGSLTGSATPARRPSLSNTDDDAITALVALGERRADAEQLLIRVKRLLPADANVNALVREMLKMRTMR